MIEYAISDGLGTLLAHGFEEEMDTIMRHLILGFHLLDHPNAILISGKAPDDWAARHDG